MSPPEIDKPNIRTEAIAGITTFFTMSYIVVVNPSILSTEGTGMAFSGVLTATVLLCFVMTLFMGLYAKLPFAVAPGMGINAFFTFTIILTQKVWWQVALGIVFWAGVLFLLISITPVREIIAKAIPAELRLGTAAGIGIRTDSTEKGARDPGRNTKNVSFAVSGVGSVKSEMLPSVNESAAIKPRSYGA